MAGDALDGAPGIYSARWAGAKKDFNYAMDKVWRAVQDKGAEPPIRAQFICALSLAWPDGHNETFEGIVAGRLVWRPRGVISAERRVGKECVSPCSSRWSPQH